MANRNRRLSRWEIWIRNNPGKEMMLGTLATTLALVAIFLVFKWDGDRTYTVHKSSRTQEIMKILDPKGKEVDLSDAEVKKITYEVIWVK